jgi:hypothetical protein
MHRKLHPLHPLHPLHLLTALLAASAWPAPGAPADPPPAERGQDEVRGDQDGEKGDAKDEVTPLDDERTKRFMQFGKIPDRLRDDGAPKVGEDAPPLKLKALEGEQEVDLVSFAGKKPVILLFGSYT